jgi:hypothetical protein
MSYQSINVKLTPTTANRPAEHVKVSAFYGCADHADLWLNQ